MSVERVVAIDGPAGSGKSTLAAALAAELGLPYVNTGLMYRALTVLALRRGVDVDDGPELGRLMSQLSFTVEPGERPREPMALLIGGIRDDELVDARVEAAVSAVARHPEVRTPMRAAQRELGAGGAVMEGRDIGSVVFPDAAVKLFVIADLERRAARRAGERGADDIRASAALRARDALDARTNPLRPAPDAIVIDTTDLDVDETLRRALETVRRRAPELAP